MQRARPPGCETISSSVSGTGAKYADTVREITRAAYAKWISGIGRKPKPMAANYEQAVVDHIVDLVVEDGQPVALIEVIPEFSNEPPYLLIENVAVLPNWHGKGIGSWMLGHADSIAVTSVH